MIYDPTTYCSSGAHKTNSSHILAPALLRSWQWATVASKEVKPVKLHRLEVLYRELMGALPHHQRTDFVRKGLTCRSSGEPQSPPGTNHRSELPLSPKHPTQAQRPPLKPTGLDDLKAHIGPGAEKGKGPSGASVQL